MGHTAATTIPLLEAAEVSSMRPVQLFGSHTNELSRVIIPQHDGSV